MDQELPNGHTTLAYEQLTVSNSAKALTASKYTDANNPTVACLIQAQTALVTVEGTAGTNDVRWRTDGTDPTSSSGVLLQAGKTLLVRGTDNIIKFRAIRTGSADVTVNVVYQN